MRSFAIGHSDFLLDGEPFQIISGALHYFRIPPELWADRIRKAQLLGLNTIETYVPWNFHAPSPGAFTLTGWRDLGRFLDLIAAEGLFAIVRPGPYICAEWDNGGLPAWLTSAGVRVRRPEPAFVSAMTRYFDHLLPVVAARQVTAGGPVLMVQVENEYGAYPGVPRPEREQYLRTLVALIRERGITVPLFTCDQADDEHFELGGLPELHKTATFGSRSRERLAVLRRHQPTGPLMCAEFWDGWFDSWGLPHHTTSASDSAADLAALLETGASVNLYMVHGGTNFGFTNGANDKGTYLPITTSYDYDAPLSERGAATKKYWAYREVISRFVPVPEEVPSDPAPAPEFELLLPAHLPLWEVLDLLTAEPEREFSSVPTLDDLEQWTGFGYYEVALTADDAVVSVAEVRDWALAALDRSPVGVLDRTTNTKVLPLPARAGTLAVLVEDRGRVNYGPRIGEPKGLIGPVYTARRELTSWRAAPVCLPDAPARLATRWAGLAAPPTPPETGGGLSLPAELPEPLASTGSVLQRPLAGPVFARGVFDSRAGADHFLRLDGWTRGLAWLNGELLGRYSSQGPTGTLYLPGPMIRAEANELVLLELVGATAPRVRFVAAPDLGPTEV